MKKGGDPLERFEKGWRGNNGDPGRGVSKNEKDGKDRVVEESLE